MWEPRYGELVEVYHEQQGKWVPRIYDFTRPLDVYGKMQEWPYVDNEGHGWRTIRKYRHTNCKDGK